MNLSPLVFPCRLKMEEPSSSDKTADADRVLKALAEYGYPDIDISLPLLRRLPEELRKNRFSVTLVIGRQGDGLKVLDIGREKIFGLAIDIGSTNIECSIFDLVSGTKLDETGMENPQVIFGNDVLTRVQRSMTGDFGLLTNALLDGLSELIAKICGGNNVSSEDIFAVTIAGNTIMSHFFLGLEVNNIPISPYIPAVSSAVFTSGRETGLAVNGNALVYVFPNAGSYVGGDIISGLISSGVYNEEEPVLFIDVGTNVEITLGCRDWIMVGAGAAGPALEGGVAGIGKKAEAGTISRVRIDSRTGEIQMDVISGEEPKGICGSGLIDLISEMYSADIIDRSGRFVSSGDNIIEKDGVKAYLLHRSGQEELYLTEAEIKNFLLSKAAMFSFLYVFVRAVGLTFRDIKKVFVAGALGCGINPESAINIGMLPDMPRERFIPVGNSSLKGAEMVLLNRDLLCDVENMTRKITYREMNEDAELMNILQGAMFIPHTEPEMLKG
ncbi:MAG: DUF4445 domain-containing protein [Nitrospirae bacterium]|nr:DUF4445 domain-containing protein [Nitrospirota bacterium]